MARQQVQHGAEAHVVAGGGVRVVFEWRGDRFGHRVELAGERGAGVLLFASVEEGTELHVPASPPVQDLRVQAAAGGTSSAAGSTVHALGVGMAGRSHWSFVCGARAADDTASGSPSLYSERLRGAAAGQILFEIACRVRDERPGLASTYRLGPGVYVNHAEDTLLEVTTADGRVRVRSFNATIHATEDGFALRAADAAPAVTPRTVQWSYKLFTDPTACRTA